MLESGDPKNTEGMKSKKVWVVAIEMMKMIELNGGILTLVVNVINNTAIRLMCTLGMSPVKVPAKIPKINGMMICSMSFFIPFLLI